MYEKILVPFDGSPTSEQALKEAAGLALKLGAQVRLLHIIDPLTHAVGFVRPEVYRSDFLPAAHGEIFDKALFANWSLAWQSGAACQFNCAYHAALPQAVDWNQGQVAVFSLAWSAEFSPANWIEEVGLPYLAALPGLRHWIMYGNPRYLIAWVLLDTGAFDRDLLRCALARVSPPHHSARLGFLSVSRDARVSATAAPAPPVDFDSGETLHVLLRDRT